jgi:hypothetical protein
MSFLSCTLNHAKNVLSVQTERTFFPEATNNLSRVFTSRVGIAHPTTRARVPARLIKTEFLTNGCPD